MPKSFRPIVLLNTLGKLIEKFIDERLQFQVTANNFIPPSQLGGLKFKSTIDVDMALTHIIQLGWVKNISTSTLVLQIKDLRVGQWKEPYIGLIQENSIENSVQDCLPYIQIPNGLYKLFLTYPKWPCVHLKVNMCIIRCMTLFF